MDKLFFLAQLSFGVHIVFSFALLLVTRNEPVAEKLFVQPNKFLGEASWIPRLLQAEYFIPWKSAPSEMLIQPIFVKTMFWVCRLAGASFVVLIASLFIGAFLVAGGHA